LADSAGVSEYAGDGPRHVVDKDRLEAGIAANQRYYWEKAGKVSDRSKEGVARAEHGARADDCGLREVLPDHLFAASTGTDVRRTRTRIGADTRYKHKTGDTRGDSLPCHRFSPSDVHCLESRIALLDIGRDRVDDRVGPSYRVGHRYRVTHIGGNDSHQIETDRS
jgi:hypothetical protein